MTTIRSLNAYLLLGISSILGILYSVQNPLLPYLNEFRDRVFIIGWAIGILLIYRCILVIMHQSEKYLLANKLAAIGIITCLFILTTGAIQSQHSNVGKNHLSQPTYQRQAEWMFQGYPTYISRGAQQFSKYILNLEKSGKRVALLSIRINNESSQIEENDYPKVMETSGNSTKFKNATLSLIQGRHTGYICAQVQMLTQVPCHREGAPSEGWPAWGITKRLLKISSIIDTNYAPDIYNVLLDKGFNSKTVKENDLIMTIWMK